MMLSKHRLDLGVLGELECDVESAATIVRKPTEDNYDSVDILRVTVPLGPVRADVTKLLSDEAIEEIREKIAEGFEDCRPTQRACVTV